MFPDLAWSESSTKNLLPKAIIGPVVSTLAIFSKTSEWPNFALENSLFRTVQSESHLRIAEVYDAILA
jgi:hypothetical protein